jgi:hypothetical protein
MAINYFYIDDDPQATIEETARGLSVHQDKLIVTAFQHKKWQEELEFLIDRQEQIDGLLLDWNLSKANATGDEANFDVEALAAQIRKSNITKKFKSDFPIVLCSADFSFKNILQRKPLSKGLFDTYYEKDDFDSHRDSIIEELVALADGYRAISEGGAVINLLGLDNDEDCDYRILEYLSLLRTDMKVHEVAAFILSGIVKITGVLIDENLLGARFGVDIKQNREEWLKLKGILTGITYKGVFAAGWPRWWANQLTKWWDTVSSNSLGSLSGPERVAILNEKLGLNLVPAAKTEKSKSDYFWVIDQKTKSPIALQDAILTIKDLISRYPWEDDEYFSIDSALTEDIQNIHPLDRDKVAKLKVQFTRVRRKQ